MGGHVRRRRFVLAVVGLLLASAFLAQWWPASELQAEAGPRLFFPLMRRAFPPLPGG